VKKVVILLSQNQACLETIFLWSLLQREFAQQQGGGGGGDRNSRKPIVKEVVILLSQNQACLDQEERERGEHFFSVVKNSKRSIEDHRERAGNLSGKIS